MKTQEIKNVLKLSEIDRHILSEYSGMSLETGETRTDETDEIEILLKEASY